MLCGEKLIYKLICYLKVFCDVSVITIPVIRDKKVQVGKAQPEKESTPKTEVGKN